MRFATRPFPRTTASILPLCVVPMLAMAGCTSARPAASTAAPTAAVSAARASPSASGASTVPTPSTAPLTTPSRKLVQPASPRPPVPRVKAKVVALRPVVDPLTGGAPNSSPVIAVKIDNTYVEVPQFGVSDADVVFVEQVEGGLSRLIAVFHSTMPSEVGPVRSVRSTDAQLLPAFGKPALVFAGGAAGPMTALAATSIVDTTGLTNAYFRSDAAASPYNLHADLRKVLAQVHGVGPVRDVGFRFASTSPLIPQGRPVRALHVVLEAAVLDFSYTGGRFVRIRDGQQVSDHQGRPEAADNVVVQHVVDQPDGTVDVLGSPSYLSRTVGSGALSLFRNGRMIPGSWKRARATDPFSYLDIHGRPLPFKPGKTWIVLAPQTAKVTVR